MFFYIALVILIAIIIYLAVAYGKISTCGKKTKKLRGELTRLFIDRANMMPPLLNAARKCSPIPESLYGDYLKARQNFAEAREDSGVFSANENLSLVFAELFKRYAVYDNAYVGALHTEYLKILEKIGFTAEFYNSALEEQKSCYNNLPFRPAAVFFSIVNQALDKIYDSLKNINQKN